EYPVSRFVADFIGSVNIFEGRLIEDEPDHVRIRAADLDAVIHVDHGISSAPDATVWAAIRPEKMTIGRERPEGSENLARGVVQEIAYMGDLSIYRVRLGSGRLVRVTRPNVLRHPEDRIGRDEQVYLSWHPSSPVVLTR
ncbi:MAG: TOBE domain-containing protein, partial [Gammaproteobacteria bacterium]|nr:TOBE domain-containing protein [Gammaproteobacteria bacterium]